MYVTAQIRVRAQLYGGGSGTHQEVTGLFYKVETTPRGKWKEKICSQQGVKIAGKTNLLKDYFNRREPAIFRNLAVSFLKGEGLAPAQQGFRGGLRALWSRAVFREAKFMGLPLLVRSNSACSLQGSRTLLLYKYQTNKASDSTGEGTTQTKQLASLGNKPLSSWTLDELLR